MWSRMTIFGWYGENETPFLAGMVLLEISQDWLVAEPYQCNQYLVELQ